jgi:beta-phosphoglucomutase
MTEIKAGIFDLDGVIVDTAKYHYIAWRRLANQLGFDLSEAENEQLKGISRMESLDIILKIGGVTLDEEQKLKFATEKNAYYLELCMKMTPDEVLPGVRSFLGELRENGLGIALGSASKNAGTILKQIEMLSFFDVLVDGNQVVKGKPDPEVFLKGASGMGVVPEFCVVFEDAASGIQAAKAGGMKAVGVGNEESLAEADLVIPGFEDFSLDKLRGHFL